MPNLAYRLCLQAFAAMERAEEAIAITKEERRKTSRRAMIENQKGRADAETEERAKESAHPGR